MRLTSGVLHRDVGRRDFVACTLALVEPPAPGQRGPRLRLVTAGQVPPILCRDGRAQELESPGERFPLGVLPEPQYEDLVVDLEPGDVVLFTTDGLPEAPARALPEVESAEAAGRPAVAPPETAGELFGFGRLSASAAHWTTHATDVEGIASGVWGDVDAWSGEASGHDDMTLVVLRVPGT
jgi:serine phosphatase RsbU (regulator of sigma subunit)